MRARARARVCKRIKAASARFNAGEQGSQEETSCFGQKLLAGHESGEMADNHEEGGMRRAESGKNIILVFCGFKMSNSHIHKR